MEYERQSQTAAPLPAEAGPDPADVDPAVFARVWRRVMPQDRPDCPFTLTQAPAEVQAALAPRPGALPAVCAPPAERPCAPDNDVPCLGAASAVHGPQLQGYIAGELSAWKLYQALARRAGAGGRVLAAIAADERRHAKRLSAAYFLISGVRFWPAEQAGAAPFRALPGALRQRFADEQRELGAYQAAAAETADPCLRELFLELAGEEAEHARLLRGLLEQM